MSTLVAFLLTGICESSCAQENSSASFVHWETAPLHPIALSPDGKNLAVCNLPDNRLELFRLDTNKIQSVGSVVVGLDPVSVRFRTDDEIWVVNRISDSISIVSWKAQRVIFTLQTLDSPADIAFAGSPQRGFVSCSAVNTVQIFDPVSRQPVGEVALEAEEPRALAVSRDGRRVFVAFFESGNGSTILGSGVGQGFPRASVVDFEEGPHGGANPPPNRAEQIEPPLAATIPSSNKPPRVSLIVKKNNSGRWMDDNEGDWTEFVRGTNAVFSGRTAGWDLPDHDVAIIETTDLTVSYLDRLMNICMDVAVHPVTGQLAVIGTDALNEIRFEPNLKGIFSRVNLALADPRTRARQIKDLNPHLDYKTPTLPLSERKRSMGDPRGIVWNAAGTRAYVTGMGSDNVIVLDAEVNRAAPPIQVGEGPTGLALDEARHRLYVLNRFSSALSIIDTGGNTVIETVPLFDPTPAKIKMGRKHLYNTHKSSGLGQAACGSCHVDSRFDRLAWVLGSPSGKIKKITSSTHNFARLAPPSTNDFHPMKGPMVTQTLQDIIGHEPFHWRGDRDGLEEFNGTFRDLQGSDRDLTSSEMQEFEDFLSTIHFPPNPFRNFDNSLKTTVVLSGHFSLGRGSLPRGAPLPNGNAQAGLALFRDSGSKGCIECHTLPAGLGPDLRFLNLRWTALPIGPKGEHHVALVQLDRASQLPFKIPQLRNLYEKIGARFNQTKSLSGFGFLHDGSVDTLTRFVQDAFDFRSDQETSDLIAFLLSLTGSDLPVGSATDQFRAPGVASRDVPAAVGQQITIVNSAGTSRVAEMIALAQSANGRVDLVVKGSRDGTPRGWLYDRSKQTFQSDRKDELISTEDLLALAAVGNELTWTMVPRGSGQRIGIDRDEDGFFDRNEIEAGSNPASPWSVPGNTAPTLGLIPPQSVVEGQTLIAAVNATDTDAPPQQLRFSLEPGAPIGAAIDSLTGVFTWTPSAAQGPGTYRIVVRVTDNGVPSLSNTTSFTVQVVDPQFQIQLARAKAAPGRTEISWRAASGKRYRVEFKNKLDDPIWSALGEDVVASGTLVGITDTTLDGDQRFYRIQLLE